LPVLSPDALLPLLTRLASGTVLPPDEAAELLGLESHEVDACMQILADYGVRRRRDGSLRVPGGIALLDESRVSALLPEAIRHDIAIEVHGVTASTNDIARARIEDGRYGARSILAEAQTAGRGRRGRGWASPVASNLYLTHVEPLAGGLESASGLSLVVGVAAAEAIESSCGIEVLLKWPNDLIVADRKLGGILVELVLGGGAAHCVLGIGVNVRVPAHVGAGIDQAWVDLTQVTGGPVDRNELAAAIVGRLHEHMVAFRSLGFDDRVRRAWQARDPYRDRRIVARSEQGELRGIARGIDASGALVIETGTGRTAIGAGEVSIRLEERS